MKKQLLLICLFSITMLSVFAQTRKISGKVTSAENGESLVAVTISVKGTSIGVITDIDGKYSLEVPENGKTLAASFVGMKTIEVPITSSQVYDFALESQTIGLDEVVVTALGISKEKKALGYAVQDVSGEVIQKTAPTNVINSLSGKSAGVYVNSSSGNVGSSSRIVIRGNQSLKGDNQPLFVVDGVPIDNSIVSSSKGGYDFTDMGSGAGDLNPSDIAEITILKGGNASALYGSRGANGVVLITTKLGNKKGFSVEIESNTTFTNPLLLPDYQDEYGQGANGQFWYKDGMNGGKYDGLDETFGPKLDYVVQPEDIVEGGDLYWAVQAGFPQTPGSILSLPQFNSPIDPTTGERIPTPWISHPDNIKNFFETGITTINNISLSNGGAWGNMRLSLTNSDEQGMTPNTYLKKNTVQFSGNANLTDKLSLSAKGSYISTEGNMPGTGYTFNNVMMQTIWAARQVDWEYEKTHYENADGTQDGWINRYHNNPYWIQYKNLNPMSKNRLIASASIKYEFTDWLSLVGRIGTDYSNQQQELIRAYYGINDKEGSYSVTNSFRQEVNADFLLTADKSFENKITVSGSLGGNMMNKVYNNQNSSAAKLVVPNVYSLSNSKETPTTSYYKSEREIQSLYAFATIDYNNQVFLDLTGRNDWSSTLPEKNNSYFYPSVTTSWIFNETFDIAPEILTFGKIRLGWSQVGNDASAYMTDLTYSAATPYGSLPSFSLSSTLPPLDLKNELVTSEELGLDLKFFENRLGLDVTLYKSKSENQILNAAISPTSGFTLQTMNAGRIDNKGVEVILSTTPVRTSDFSWDVLVNWSKNKNEIIELDGDIKSLLLHKEFGVEIVAPVGGSYGTMMGTGFVYHENGKPIVNANGYPQRSAVKEIGNIMPDWIGSMTNTFTYKNLSLYVNIDVRKGGDLFSFTNASGFGTGVLQSSAGLNDKGNPLRDPVEDGGGYLFDGVFEDGTTNNVYQDMNNFRWFAFNQKEAWTYDASYVKLREVALSYALPSELISKIFLKGMSVSLYGRNLAILHKNVPNIDPEVSNKDASISSQGIEFGANPSARNIGFKIKLTI